MIFEHEIKDNCDEIKTKLCSNWVLESITSALEMIAL